LYGTIGNDYILERVMLYTTFLSHNADVAISINPLNFFLFYFCQ